MGSHTEITPKHTDIRKDRENKSPLYLIQHTGDSNRKPDSHSPHYDLLVNCPNYRELAYSLIHLKSKRKAERISRQSRWLVISGWAVELYMCLHGR